MSVFKVVEGGQEEKAIQDKHNHEDNMNPIYDSIEDDIVKLEEILSNEETQFSSVTKENWRSVVSPSSSLSSINSDDSDDYTMSSPDSQKEMFELQHDYSFISTSSFEEARVSLQEIHEQIGVAEEINGTPSAKQKSERHLLGLETIHEGKFLDTPPKNITSHHIRGRQYIHCSNMSLEGLERD